MPSTPYIPSILLYALSTAAAAAVTVGCGSCYRPLSPSPINFVYSLRPTRHMQVVGCCFKAAVGWSVSGQLRATSGQLYSFGVLFKFHRLESRRQRTLLTASNQTDGQTARLPAKRSCGRLTSSLSVKRPIGYGSLRLSLRLSTVSIDVQLSSETGYSSCECAATRHNFSEDIPYTLGRTFRSATFRRRTHVTSWCARGVI